MDIWWSIWWVWRLALCIAVIAVITGLISWYSERVIISFYRKYRPGKVIPEMEFYTPVDSKKRINGCYNLLQIAEPEKKEINGAKLLVAEPEDTIIPSNFFNDMSLRPIREPKDVIAARDLIDD